MSWDPDPIINRDINIKRTALAIQYMSKIDEWLADPGKPKKEELKNCKRAILGEITKLTLHMLSKIENILGKVFPVIPRIRTIDLTEDDEDEVEETAVPCAKSVTPASPSRIEQSSVNDSSLLQVQPQPLIDVPTAASLPRVESLFNGDENIETPSTSLSPTLASPSTKAPPRRKSVSQRPPQSLANKPLISTYKIKHNAPKPPSAYAKTSDAENVKPRQIIDVPYKMVPNPRQIISEKHNATAPKKAQLPRQLPYDPKEECVRLEGIKQRIYADKFLSFDAQAKEDLKRKFLAQKKKTVDTSSRDDTSSPEPPPRDLKRKSLAQKKKTVDTSSRDDTSSPEPPPRDLKGKFLAQKKKTVDTRSPEPTPSDESDVEMNLPVETSVEKPSKSIVDNINQPISTKKKELPISVRKVPTKKPMIDTVPTTQKRNRGRPKKIPALVAAIDSCNEEVDTENHSNEVPSHVLDIVDEELAEMFNEVNNNEEYLGDKEDLLVEISESEAYRPPAKRGPKKGCKRKTRGIYKRRNAIDEYARDWLKTQQEIKRELVQD